jgi:hypothetical protein
MFKRVALIVACFLLDSVWWTKTILRLVRLLGNGLAGLSVYQSASDGPHGCGSIFFKSFGGEKR